MIAAAAVATVGFETAAFACTVTHALVVVAAAAVDVIAVAGVTTLAQAY